MKRSCGSPKLIRGSAEVSGKSNGRPLKLRSEVALHVREERARMSHKVHLGAVFRRDDQLEEQLVPRALPALEEGAERDLVPFGVEAQSLVIGPRSALTSEIAPVDGPAAGGVVADIRDFECDPLKPRLKPRPKARSGLAVAAHRVAASLGRKTVDCPEGTWLSPGDAQATRSNPKRRVLLGIHSDKAWAIAPKPDPELVLVPPH